MDKKFLLRLDDTFKSIKTKLLLNEDIRKMLYYDVVDENTIAPPIELAAEHVFTQPVIAVETTEPFNKRNYITITSPEGDKSGNKMDYIIRIIIMCDKSSWNLNSSARPLLLAQEVINELNNEKFKLSNPLSFSNIVETVTSKDVCGYSLLFDTTDGISEADEK